MPLTAGIVGLPNVGKSTLYNAITNSKVIAANYPFATITPTTGVVEVPDSRLDVLEKMFESKKKVPAIFEFTDIAGLVKGASKGEGLGNQFLAAIREVDAIVHVVRCFDDSEIVHVDGTVNPLRDIETINFELIFADTDSVLKRISKVEKKAQTVKDKESVFEYQALTKIIKQLELGQPARSAELTKEEFIYAKTNFHLLTLKPVIYCANVADEDLISPTDNKYFQLVKEFAHKEGNGIIAISAKSEEELSSLSKEEKKEFLSELGIAKSGLETLVQEVYTTLGLKTYFTAGEVEVHAWTFKNNMKAPECAGIIHTDFEKGFIRAEVYSYEDLIACGSEAQVKEKGKWRLEGKEYLMKDGDIVHFRFSK